MNNVVLVGFMGCGKTTVGRELADRLQRSFIDLDEAIEADAGRTIAEIFSTEGEAAFREREARGLQHVLEREEVVIAAGGGAPLREENWRMLRDGNTVVALMAEPDELARRLDGGGGRPLLGDDPAAAIATLLPQRLATYMDADLIVRTDRQAASDVAARIAHGLPASGLDRITIGIPSSGVNLSTSHEVFVGRKLGAVIASSVQRLRPSGPILLVTDDEIAERHGAPLQNLLRAFGLDAAVHSVPAGEKAKEMSVLAEIYDALGRSGVDRQGLMVVLGGGTVGDVAGFAAATWMRGIRYLQVPTTVLAMVDSSIGGKTAINLPVGKNMAGAVHQPAAIFCDLDFVSTLPGEEYRAALAEVIKAAMIADAEFAQWLVDDMAALLQRAPRAVQRAVTRAIRIKARLVSRDPYETGIRAVLNYGHTVGHALERAAGYGRIRHGEAVAWGMEVAARISLLSERCDERVAQLQHRLLEAAGLLAHSPVVDRSELVDALRHDKKARGGRLRWVLLRDVGQADYGCEVDTRIVDTALSEVLSV